VVVSPVAAPMALPADMIGIAADVGVRTKGTPGAAPKGSASKAQVKALRDQLTAAVTDKAMVDATLKFATQVRDLAQTLRMVGDDTTDPARRRPIIIATPIVTARSIASVKPTASSR